MSQKQTIVCDGCGREGERLPHYALNTYYFDTDPLPTTKDFCTFKCLAVFVAQGDPAKRRMMDNADR